MRKRSIATAVAATIIGALVVGPPGPLAGAVDDPVTTDAVAWLVDQQEPDGGFELADFPGFETPDAVLAIAEQAQVEPAWSKPLARAAVDAVVSSDGFTPLDQLDDLVEGLVEGTDGDTPADVASRGAQLAKILALVILPLQGTPGIAPSDFDPSGDSAAPVDIRPTVLASAGDGTFSAMTFNGRLYVLLVGGTQPAVLIDHVKAAQQPNGAWNFSGTPSGHSVDADTTGLALQALSVRDVPSSDPAIRNGLAALAESQQPDGSWLSFGVEDPNSTALATLGIRATGGDPNTPCWREALDDAWAGVHYADPADWLRGEQAADGHIAAPADEFGVTTFATSQAVQAILGLNPLFDAVSPAPACADVADDERFVHSAYADLLGRLADDSGTAYQAGRLRAGASSGYVIRTMTGTAEYRRAVVNGFYEDYFGRAADRAGLATWSPWVTVLRVRVQASLLASGEYFRKAGSTDEGYVDALYRDILGRPADQAGRASYVAQLAFGRSRSSVAQTLLTSREARGVLVDELYDRLLRRPPDAAGRAYWRSRLVEGTSVEAIIASLAGSAEYVRAAAS